jgi:hypothetical protein
MAPKKENKKEKERKRAFCLLFVVRWFRSGEAIFGRKRMNEMKAPTTTGWHATRCTRATPPPELERKSAAAANYREITATNWSGAFPPLSPLPLPRVSCCVAAHHQPDLQIHEASFGYKVPGACQTPV